MKLLRLLIILGLVLFLPAPGFSQEGEDDSETQTQQVGTSEDSGTDTSGEEVRREITESLPLMEIKRMEAENPVFSIELRNVELADLFRVIAHDYELNILVDRNVTGTVTASLTNISLEEALERIADMHGLVLEKKGNVIIVKPHLVTKVFILAHVAAGTLLGSTSIEASGSSETTSDTSSDSSSTTTSSSPQASIIYDLLSEEGKVLLGQQPNSIMVIDYPENVAKIGEYIKMADEGMAMKVFKLKYINASDLVGSTSSSSEIEEGTGEGEESTDASSYSGG